MRYLVAAILCLMMGVGLYAQSPCNDQTSVTYQGYEYDIVEIGDQCWFAENCRYLPSVSSSIEGSETDPYYYVYDYQGTDVTDAKSTENYDTYGVLYNWPAVMTEGICPTSWHVPSDGEWQTLEMSLGMSESEASSTGWRGTDEGYQMKSTSGWDDSGNGSNSSGFSGLPGGYRGSNDFAYDGNGGSWWSTSEYDSSSLDRGLDNVNDYVVRSYNSRYYGFSARCVTNQLIVQIPGCTDPTASNYDSEATEDDGSCIIICVASDCCISGTQWDLNTMTCVYEDACSADIAKDGFVAVDDLLELLSAFGSSCDEVATGIGGEECVGAECCGENTIWCETLEICIPFISCPADLNDDESIGVDDLLTFLISYGGACEEYESLPDCEVTVSPWMCGDLIDHEGYEYSTVQIGNQCWFSENCRYLPSVSHPNVGDMLYPVYYVYDYYGLDIETAKASENYQTYGVLYNWPAVMTEGICPSGWNIPSDEEFTQLTNFLGGADIAGGMMKSISGWVNDGNGSNSSGFNALPGGDSVSNGFYNSTAYGFWWSSSIVPQQDQTSWARYLVYSSDYINSQNQYRDLGYSARCIKD